MTLQEPDMVDAEVQESPILFKPEMVRAILDGRKTQTRRVVKFPSATPDRYLGTNGAGDHVFSPTDCWGGQIRCPYGQPGDELWVRESFRTPEEVDHLPPSDIYTGELARLARAWCPTKYEADGYEAGAADECHLYGLEWSLDSWRGWGRLRPSIHMPRRVSRIQLEITEVRVERVQEITPSDVVAEGVIPPDPGGPTRHFAELWDSINASRGYSWASNPWVWVVEFRVLRPSN